MKKITAEQARQLSSVVEIALDKTYFSIFTAAKQGKYETDFRDDFWSFGCRHESDFGYMAACNELIDNGFTVTPFPAGNVSGVTISWRKQNES